MLVAVLNRRWANFSALSLELTKERAMVSATFRVDFLEGSGLVVVARIHGDEDDECWLESMLNLEMHGGRFCAETAVYCLWVLSLAMLVGDATCGCPELPNLNRHGRMASRAGEDGKGCGDVQSMRVPRSLYSEERA